MGPLRWTVGVVATSDPAGMESMAGRVTSYAGISGKTNFGSHMVAELRQAVGTGRVLACVGSEFGNSNVG